MNISAVNIGHTEETTYKNSIYTQTGTGQKNLRKAAEILAGSAVNSLGATTGTSTAARGIQSLIGEAEDVKQQIQQSAADAKASFGALVKKMSGTDCVQMDEEGYNLNDLEPEEIITVVDRIKIELAAYCDDYEATGSVDADKIKEVVGNTAMAGKIEEKLSGADLPATQTNTTEAANAAAQAMQIGSLSEEAKNYLVKNELEPTIANLYKASHMSEQAGGSKTEMNDAARGNAVYEGSGEGKKLTQEEWEQLKPQIEKVLQQAGLEVNEQNLNNAREMLEQDIPVTQENLIYKNVLDQLDLDELQTPEGQDKLLNQIVDAMRTGEQADSAVLTDDASLWTTVSEALATVENAGASEVTAVVNSEEVLTIGALQNALEEADTQTTDSSWSLIENMSTEELSAYIQLEEIRIMMTANAGMALAKQGFDLDTTPIAKLIEQLKVMEQGRLSAATETTVTDEEMQTVYDVQKALRDIEQAPDVSIGAVLAENDNYVENTYTSGVWSIEQFANAGISFTERAKRAGETYEAVGTQIRTDLGDSMLKAVAASTEDILANLELEDNKANRDAIRILGWNAMEMTTENVNAVKEAYTTLNNLIDNMKPETVLQMIRDNVNPMQSDIREVNQYLEENNLESDNEKFSRFLYKLEQTEGISQKEREQFIGVYKMMNLFRRDAGKVVGTVLSQGNELTMANLMTAYNSSRAAGIDVTLDEQTGFAEVAGTVAYYRNLFDATAEQITPRTLREVQAEQEIASRSVENFCEAVDENYDAAEEAVYYEKYLEQLSEAASADDVIFKELSGSGERITVDQIQAMQAIMETGYYGRTIQRLPEDTYENLHMPEAFASEEGLSEAAEQLQDATAAQITAALENAENTEITSEQFEALRMQGKEIGLITNLAKRHDYRVPFEIDGEIGTIHLQLVEDAQNSGRIAISMKGKELGNVSVEVHADAEQIRIYAAADGEEQLESRMEQVSEAISGLDCAKDKEVQVVSSHVSKVVEADYQTQEGQIQNRELYVIAKEIVVNLSGKVSDK